jgi:hypothetical protein
MGLVSLLVNRMRSYNVEEGLLYTASTVGTKFRHRRISDVHRYVIITNAQYSILSILPVFIRWW